MKVTDYIKKYFNKASYAAYLTLCAVAGIIPATVIIVRARLIDDAAATLEGSTENAFFILLSLFCAMSLASFLLKAIIARIEERHKMHASARFDFLRMNKAARVGYPLTETKEFHSLLNKCSKASEIDADIWKSSGDFFRNVTAITLSVIVIAFADLITAFGIIILLSVGIILNRHAARKYCRSVTHSRNDTGRHNGCFTQNKMRQLKTSKKAGKCRHFLCLLVV